MVIVGSRQILVREMDRHGDWVNEFRLAKRIQQQMGVTLQEVRASIVFPVELADGHV